MQGVALSILALVCLAVSVEDILFPNGLKITEIDVPKDCTYKAQTGDYIHQDYTGYLVDGTVFDSSYSRGRPYNFHLGMGDVITGVDMGMDGMCEGENRTLVFPPELGYGNREITGIPAGSTLKFVVRLTYLDPSGYHMQTLYKPDDCSVKAQKDDYVRMHYNGTLSDHSIFDSSYKRGKTYNFTLGHGKVIKGMDMGILGMCVGERRKITIPSILGYGREGIKGMIPGGETITFYVELVDDQGTPSSKA